MWGRKPVTASAAEESGKRPTDVALTMREASGGRGKGSVRAAVETVVSVFVERSWARAAAGAGEGEVRGDGAGGSAGPEDDSVLAGWVGGGPEALEEAFAIGVFAPPEAIGLADGAVDGSRDAGGIAEGIEVTDDGDLVGDAAVEADESLGLGSGDRGGEVSRADFHIDVAGMDSVVAERGFHHDHCGIFGDRLGEAADQGGQEVGHDPGLIKETASGCKAGTRSVKADVSRGSWSFSVGGAGRRFRRPG
jgi:hypothetical protein